MKENPLTLTLNQLAEEGVPADLDLRRAIHHRLETSKSRPHKGVFPMKASFAPTPRRIAVWITIIVLFVVATFLLTPQGQMFAQKIWKYFDTVPETSFDPPWPTPILVPTFTLEANLVYQPGVPTVGADNCGTVISPISSTFVCQLQDAQTRLGFAVKSFPAQYVDVPFHSLWVDPKTTWLHLTFRGQGSVYTLAQGLGDFLWHPVYEGAVQPVQVGQYPAEFVAGSFIFPDGEPYEPWVWNADEPFYRLRWKENERWYEFTLARGQPGESGLGEIQDEMIQIAENLVGLDQGTEKLAAGNQPSIKDSIGFTIKEPGLLPGGFQQAPYGGWSNLTTAPRVTMYYEYQVNGEIVNSLKLDQMLIPSDDQTLRREFAVAYQSHSLINGEWTNPSTDEEVYINDITGYYLYAGATTEALYWCDDEREYLLTYHWAPDFGGRLDKATLISIAENLK